MDGHPLPEQPVKSACSFWPLQLRKGMTRRVEPFSRPGGPQPQRPGASHLLSGRRAEDGLDPVPQGADERRGPGPVPQGDLPGCVRHLDAGQPDPCPDGDYVYGYGIAHTYDGNGRPATLAYPTGLSGTGTSTGDNTANPRDLDDAIFLSEHPLRADPRPAWSTACGVSAAPPRRRALSFHSEVHPPEGLPQSPGGAELVGSGGHRSCGRTVASRRRSRVGIPTMGWQEVVGAQA
jgi:hypothetical protein